MSDSLPGWDSPLVQFGVGAFETLRCESGNFPLLRWHRDRISRALEIWGVAPEKLEAPWQSLLERGRALEDVSHRRVKLLIGLTETDELVHHVFDFSFAPNSQSRTLRLESQRIFLPQSFKTTSYEEHYWARRKAAREGVSDVLYVDEKREMLEASTSCLLIWDGSHFLVRDKGPVLASTSLASLRSRYPEDFKPISAFPLSLTERFPLLMMSALNGMAHVGRLVDGQDSHELKPIDEGLLEDWNRRLFAHSES